MLWSDLVAASGKNAVMAIKRFNESNTAPVESKNQKPLNGSSIKVAGSIPPLAESYRSDLVGPFNDNVLQYRIIVSSLLGYVDLFLCETMSRISESKAAVTAAIEVMKGIISSKIRMLARCIILDAVYKYYLCIQFFIFYLHNLSNES